MAVKNDTVYKKGNASSVAFFLVVLKFNVA